VINNVLNDHVWLCCWSGETYDESGSKRCAQPVLHIWSCCISSNCLYSIDNSGQLALQSTVGNKDFSPEANKPTPPTQKDTSSWLHIQDNQRWTLIPFFPNKNNSSSATSTSDQLKLHPIPALLGHTVSNASPGLQADRSKESSPLGQPPHIHCWTPFLARNLVVHLFIGCILCAIAVLVTLWVLSCSRNGLFTTNLQWTDVLVLWHFVPTAIATTTALAFGAVGQASLIWQPYMHLLQAEGASAEESLTLDCSGPLPVVVTKAIRKCHWVIVCFSAATLSVSFYFPGKWSHH
jgi:hypothetical protein